MQSLGSSKSSSNPAKGGFSMFRISGPGLLVLITAFLVAVIFAANQNDVVGWVVAVIALFWLAAGIVRGVQHPEGSQEGRSEAQRGAERVQRGGRPGAVAHRPRTMAEPAWCVNAAKPRKSAT